MRLCGMLLAFSIALAPASVLGRAKGTIATPADAETAVRAADAAFWTAFNACDAASMGLYLADDVEFYHDKTGLTRSRAALVESMMKGPCGSPGLRMRRQIAETGTRFDPVPGYGGVLSGDHDFYATSGKGPERLATTAHFVEVWHFEGRWRMTRVLSLAHVPVAYRPPAPGATLTVAELARYEGRYRTPDFGDIEVRLDKGALVLSAETVRVTLAAASIGHFFALERDLAFDFSGEEHGRPSTIEVRENGAVVAKGVRVD